MSKFKLFIAVRFLLLLLISHFSFFFAVAQEPKKKDLTAPETAKEFNVEKKEAKLLYGVPQFLHESSLFVQQPTKWEGSDWLKAGIVVAATFSAMSLDKTVFNEAQGRQRYYHSALVIGGKAYGSWYSIGGVAAIYGVYGLLAHDDNAKRITIELLQAGIYSEVITEVFKGIIGRARPYNNEGPQKYYPFTFTKNYYNSMPSGHTTAATALSTVMSRHAPTTFLKIIAYLPVAVTMFSRVYQDKHWLSDEIPGVAVGFFAGNWVVDLHEGKRHRINVESVYPPKVTVNINP